MTLFGIDQDRIVRQLMPELQRVTTSFQWLMRIVACAVIILLVMHIWRLGEDDRRAKEVRIWISAKQFGVSTSTSTFETERLKRENEALKKTVNEQREAIRRQSVSNDELKNAITGGVATLTQKRSELSAKEEELRRVQGRFGQSESCITSIERTLECQICTDLLERPYALSPCGHVFCFRCLQDWFRNAPVVEQGPLSILQRPKVCPCCRTRITQRPIPIFVLRATINGLAELKSQLLGVESPPESPGIDTVNGDPWEEIFSSGGYRGFTF